LLQKKVSKTSGQKKSAKVAAAANKKTPIRSAFMDGGDDRFRKFFDEAPIALFIHDKDTGEIVDANQIAIASYGYDNLEDLQKNHSWAGPPHTFEEAHAWIRKACKEGPQHFEWCSSKKNGVLFWEVVHLREVNIAGVDRILATCSDITQRKNAEEALEESEDKYRSIVEQSSEMLFLHDLEGNFLEVNRAAIARTGYSRKDLMGMRVFDMHPEGVAKEDIIDFWKKMRTKRMPVTFEAVHQCKDGSTYPAEVKINKVVLRDKECILCLVRDITERKQAEAERDLLQAQLLQAQKMESIGRLAGGVAHDFNNMLQVILGHVELVLEWNGLTQPARESLEEIRSSAQRSADITRQLLGFARKQLANPKELNLNDTVSTMLRMLQRIIGENILLEWKPGKNLWTVKIDPIQVDQILANLVINARDAMDDFGTVNLTTKNVVLDKKKAKTLPDAVPGNYVLLSVSDTGCGMDKEALEHLFEPFYTSKDLNKGAGLGMATVYGIVRQNSGIIAVRSKPRKGTTVNIYLPQAKGEASPESTVRKSGAADSSIKTILFAEDEALVLKLGKSILQRAGYKVLAAKTAEEALDAATTYTSPIHLLITDVMMPRMNGRTLRDKITSLRPEIKTLFISGYTADAIAQQGILKGNVQFLQKPFSVNAIIMCVRKILEQ
jgi:two-component system, cell cycle sensor histidine kinase and response regulator CckA